MSPAAATEESLQADYAPLTAQEARLVLRRHERDGGDIEALVEQVKAERVGPAAEWEGTPDPEVEVEPSVTELGDPDGILSDDDLAVAKAADLVAYLKEHPEEADRVEQLEQSRNGDPRSTVLDAVEAARAAGESAPGAGLQDDDQEEQA